MERLVYKNTPGADAREGINKAVSVLISRGGGTLVIEPGEYLITTELARETQRKVMNGEFSDNPEKMMFKPGFEYSKGIDLSKSKDVTVEAYGAKLIIDGFMEPLSITECENVIVKGLTIDHLRKPYSRGIIKKVQRLSPVGGAGVMTVEFPDAYPVNKNTPMVRFCVFDCHANRFSLYGELNIDGKLRREVKNQVWQFPFSGLSRDITGKELYVWHTFHSRPAVLIENSCNVCLDDVTICSQPGMGIVAHRCENLLFDGLSVMPSPGEHMSTNTDATHITSCKGTVEYRNCLFEGQGDDSVNIHTYYHTVEDVNKNSCRIFLDAPTGTHSQTADYPDKGDVLELTDKNTLCKKDTYTVLECKNIDALTSELVLDRELPEDFKNYYLADVSRQAYLYFHNCVCRTHLARGVLTKTKRVRIENNLFFDVVGTAINVTAEGYWREGICTTEEAVICRNRISFCGRTKSIRQSGSAGITVTLCAKKPKEAVHKNVLISDNIIECPDSPHGIYVSNTEKLILERNSVISKSEPVVVEEYGIPD